MSILRDYFTWSEFKIVRHGHSKNNRKVSQAVLVRFTVFDLSRFLLKVAKTQKKMSTLATPLSIAGTRQSGASVRTQNGEKLMHLTTAAQRRPAEHVSC